MTPSTLVPPQRGLEAHPSLPGFTESETGSARSRPTRHQSVMAKDALGRRHQDRRTTGSDPTPPPVLLTDATWYGTLAAARDLGSRGVPVIVGYDSATAPVRWSRYTKSAVPCPQASDVEPFIEWLVAFGERNPGCVLYPTSDDVAFLIATHRDILAPLFRLFSPPVRSLMAVLDKRSLWQGCQRAGLATPETWTPDSVEDLRDVMHELPYPVLIKPRAQILATGTTKGVWIDRPEDLIDAWDGVRAGMQFDHRAMDAAPNLDLPIVQALHVVSEQIYTVDGFVNGDGEIVGALACIKSCSFRAVPARASASRPPSSIPRSSQGSRGSAGRLASSACSTSSSPSTATRSS